MCLRGLQGFFIPHFSRILCAISVFVDGDGEAKITEPGGTLQLKANVEPDSASNKDVTWSVDNEGVATIDQDGLLTAVANGTVTIRATAKDGSGVFGTIEIVISEQNATPSYVVKVGDTELDVDAAAFLNAVAEWDGSTLVFKDDGEITFEGSLTSDDYGRESGLYLSTVGPDKDRTFETTGEAYVSLTKGETTYYIVFDATADAGPDGRTSKYLCAIPAAAAEAYDEAEELADIEEYVFDFFFGQDKATKGYVVKVGGTALDVDAAKFLNAVAEWDGSTLVFKDDGEITFEGGLTSDDYGRESGLYLSTVGPDKDRTFETTGETYVSLTKGETTYYIVFDATAYAGPDGRTSKYLCAIPAAAEEAYDEAEELADIEEYVFDFFFGQDKITSLTMSADNVNATTSVEFTMPVNTKGTVTDADKENRVRFYGVIPGISASDIQLATIPGGKPEVVTNDTERVYAGASEDDLVLAWGPEGGFPLSYVDYSGEGATTNFVATINKAGSYTVTFVFYDITAGKQLNAKGETATITVAN